MRPSRLAPLAIVAMLLQSAIAVAADAGGESLVGVPGLDSSTSDAVVVRGSRPVAGPAAPVPGAPSSQAASQRRRMPPPSYGMPAAPLSGSDWSTDWSTQYTFNGLNYTQ